MCQVKRIGVGIIGFGWMGQVHARAWSRLIHHYPELPGLPARLVHVSDSAPGRAESGAQQYGFERSSEDWLNLIADPDVDVISVTTPNFLHREMGIAVAQAGKHLWIEKPVGISSAETNDVAAAVAKSGVMSAVGFNYRVAPALVKAKLLLDDGAIGRVTNVSSNWSSDYSAHPLGALSWRFKRKYAGAGVLLDLMSHEIDLLRYLVGDVESAIGQVNTFIHERPKASTGASHYSLGDIASMGTVENDDWASALLGFKNGARGLIEASRASVGDQNNYGFVLHGTKGFIQWNFRRMGELIVSSGNDYENQSTKTIFVGIDDGDYGNFQPGAGISMGYDDLKVIEASNLLKSISSGVQQGSCVQDALAVSGVLDAIERSIQSQSWEAVSLEPTGTLTG